MELDDLFGSVNATALPASTPGGGKKRPRSKEATADLATTPAAAAKIPRQDGEQVDKSTSRTEAISAGAAPALENPDGAEEHDAAGGGDAAEKTLGPMSKATVTAVSRPGGDSSNPAAAAGAGAGGEAQGGPHTEEEAGGSQRPPAKTYPFTLDPFQAQSIAALEANESVLVSAHTSAGKTVVAEYAIAMALRDKQRVIYTSPIKALSNQKYRDLYEEFSDVGLMTGDVTINPHASCLVMTTEILRSMLYRGSEVVREVKWVVYDEIHYMRDKERGVVWEESIVMLPNTVRFVFLSATIPNASEFADWIASVKHQTCHVVHTEYRPTPLEHYLFPSGGDGVFMVVDNKGKFLEGNFAKAMALLTEGDDDPVASALMESKGKKKGKKKGASSAGQSDLFRVVKMIMERKYDPVIIFSFSKRECESYAMQLSKLDFTTDEEKALIEQVFSNAIASLSEDDRTLPQVHAILPLLKRGIGIHHGGLLPILKEVIEILFGESLVKVLLATETFAMGINMPAKTVIFTALRKFDGEQTRLVSAGEYIQMSGRAGRRGLDTRGLVIQMIGEKMDTAQAKSLLLGKADPLNSSFHLGYNMLLNLMRVEDADPQRIMTKSFHQFQSERAAPEIEAKIADLTAQAAQESGIPPEHAEAVAEYFTMGQQLDTMAQQLRTLVIQPKHVARFLAPGRLVRVQDGEVDWGWGIFVSHSVVLGRRRKPHPTAAEMATASAADVILDLLLLCDARGDVSSGGAAAANRKAKPEPCPPAVAARGGGDMRVVPVQLTAVHGLSSVRLILPRDIRPPRVRKELQAKLGQAMKRFSHEPPMLDPVADMHISEGGVADLVAGIASLTAERAITPLAKMTATQRHNLLQVHEDNLERAGEIKYLKKVLADTRSLVMKDTLKRMQRVLRRLGHTDAAGVVQVKGRVAAGINTADELVVTELVFNGAFNDLDAAQTAALLSCLVYTEHGDVADSSLPDTLSGPLTTLRETARRVATVSADAKLEVDVEEYVEHFKCDMMEVVYAWTKGSKFADICALTKVFEGSVIRVIRRLEELLRQLADASKSVGELTLHDKFLAAAKAIRRDIIFAASLYL